MKFLSKYRQHRIVVKPATHMIVGISRVYVPGKDVQFNNFEYQTEDQETIDFLMSSDDMRKGVIYKQPSMEEMQEMKRQQFEKLKAELGLEKEPKTEAVEAPKKPEAKPSGLVCDVCGKTCASELGLRAHKRSHK